nr:ABC transporter substrate-binding protein [Candidatus Njordarchaeota archaeon]
MPERRNLIIAVVLIAIIAGSSIGFYLYSTAGIPKDTFVTASIGEAEYLDPAVDYETAGGEVCQQVYEPLVQYAGENVVDLRGWLAYDNYTISPDMCTYTFWIRPGITFTDGSELNASVVKWSIDRCVLMWGGDTPAWMLAETIVGGSLYEAAAMAFEEDGNYTAIYEAAYAYLHAGGIEVTGEYKITFHVDYYDSGVPTAYPPFIYILPQPWSCPVSAQYVHDVAGGAAADASSTEGEMSVAKYILDNYAESVSLATGMGVIPCTHNEWMDEHMCGTGPFTLAEWTHQQRIVLARNDNYWGGPDNTGPAKLARVILARVNEFDTRKLMILSGQADCIYWGAIYADQLIDTTTRTILPTYAASIRVVLDKPTLTVDAAGINMAKYLSDVTATKNVNASLGVYENPMQYKKFRYAIEHCFDHAAYIAALNGFGIEPNGPIIQGFAQYDPSIPKWTYDPVKAAAYFAEVGWEGTINVYYNAGNDARKKACLLLKDGVAAATDKINIIVNELDWPTYLAKIRNTEKYPGTTINWKRPPIFFIGWMSDFPDADNNVYWYVFGQAARISWRNSTIRGLAVTAAVETNATARFNMYHELQALMYEEAPYIWTAQASLFHVERTWVHGFTYNMMLYMGMMCRYYYIWKS